jgi:hypothetical protein
METAAPLWLWLLIPVLFLTFGGALWLGVATLLGALSGWRALQAYYPDRPAAPLDVLRGQSGRMGVGVNFNGCLRLDICPGGLRVGMTRILGPFNRPFFVPWNDIAAAHRKLWFTDAVRLTFGRGAGHLDVNQKVIARISAKRPLQIA